MTTKLLYQLIFLLSHLCLCDGASIKWRHKPHDLCICMLSNPDLHRSPPVWVREKHAIIIASLLELKTHHVKLIWEVYWDTQECLPVCQALEMGDFLSTPRRQQPTHFDSGGSINFLSGARVYFFGEKSVPAAGSFPAPRALRRIAIIIDLQYNFYLEVFSYTRSAQNLI